MTETWPVEANRAGRSEAPRGALAHWIVIKDKKIDNCQLGRYAAMSDAWLPHVGLVDGGTGGFHLLHCFEGLRSIVMIDATLDGLRDLIESAALVRRILDTIPDMGAAPCYPNSTCTN